MDIWGFLASVFNKVDNIAIVVLLLGIGASFWAHVIWRREEREDRRALLDLINKNTEALNGVKLALVAMTGKVFP